MDVINRVRSSMRKNKHVLLQTATGGGKSVMASYMIAASQNKGFKSAFVVPRVNLMTQMGNTFVDFKIRHGFIASGMQFSPRPQTHICSLMTYNKVLDKITPDIIFLDEAHYGGEQIDRIVQYCRSRGIWLIGLSATPARQDNFGMGDWYDDMVLGKSIQWLVDNKYLSDCKLVRPSIKLPKGCIGGDPIAEWLKHAEGLRTIGFCRDKAHGYAMADLFTKNGISAAFMESDTHKDERREIINGLADGKIKVVFNVYMMQMGFDLAAQIGRSVNVRCMLDLQPTGSLTTQMQKNGRALRYDPAGDAVIIDLAGNSYDENHGHPCSDRSWVLDTADQHKRDVEYREKSISLVHCKSCLKASRVGSTHCLYCNTRFVIDPAKIKEVDGKLVVITPEMRAAEKKAEELAAKEKRKEVGRAMTMEDLKRIAVERGYKSGWAYNQAKIKGII